MITFCLRALRLCKFSRGISYCTIIYSTRHDMTAQPLSPSWTKHYCIFALLFISSWYTNHPHGQKHFFIEISVVFFPLLFTILLSFALKWLCFWSQRVLDDRERDTPWLCSHSPTVGGRQNKPPMGLKTSGGEKRQNKIKRKELTISWPAGGKGSDLSFKRHWK